MKKKCFTFVEILAVMAVIGILITGTAVSLNKAWENSKTDTCESELREMTTAFKGYFTDYGNIVIEPDANYENVLDEIVNVLNKKYLPYDVKVTKISDDKKCVYLETKIKEDPWNNVYKISIYTYDGEDKDSISGLVVISSAGRDAKSSEDTYKENDFGDDIIAVVEPTV